MTPFGRRVRELRRERGLLLKDMAAHLGVSVAYLSALERGERGKPTWTLLQGVLQYFRIPPRPQRSRNTNRQSRRARKNLDHRRP